MRMVSLSVKEMTIYTKRDWVLVIRIVLVSLSLRGNKKYLDLNLDLGVVQSIFLCYQTPMVVAGMVTVPE